jgi:hypothetical protein
MRTHDKALYSNVKQYLRARSQTAASAFHFYIFIFPHFTLFQGIPGNGHYALHPGIYLRLPVVFLVVRLR